MSAVRVLDECEPLQVALRSILFDVIFVRNGGLSDVEPVSVRQGESLDAESMLGDDRITSATSSTTVFWSQTGGKTVTLDSHQKPTNADGTTFELPGYALELTADKRTIED